ncbi:hypothetical protein [Nitrosomonas supralitoralis]|uniref:Uncharacterized protein n=1 Tax=Nitrosomonas supralitoralis TaxID=2116706 RepID=A0A2P7NTC7_9PROT|nr:hypothetical protein [Nitrosomonas supralitoralis]PSJ16727.1 hypothetical protein C7H79_11940 [Nitrosomonas supralitoralis]
MIELVINNKEWIFSGVGVPVLGALIFWIRNFGQRKSQGLPLTQIEQPRSFRVIPQEIPVSVPIAMERISPVTHNEIQTSIESAPPLQREAIAQRYIGQRIEWDTEFSSAKQQDSLVRLQLRSMPEPDAEYSLPLYVWCSVKLDDYRELAVLPEKTHIRINGAITDVDVLSSSVRLDNARLIFPSLKNVA